MADYFSLQRTRHRRSAAIDCKQSRASISESNIWTVHFFGVPAVTCQSPRADIFTSTSHDARVKLELLREMAEAGTVLRWQTDDAPSNRSRGGGLQNKGFGFIERHADGKSIFCHKSAIQDGNSLLPETQVRFDVEPNEQKPGQFKARNVTGGVCFSMIYTGHCNNSKCGYTHERPAKVNPDVSVDDAVAAVVASRLGPAPLLVDTVEACAAQCERLAHAGAIAVDFEGVNLCREGELLLAQLAADDGQVVLIDVATLGASAFDEGGLQALLQSEEVLKLVFDGRSDADALFHLCGCRLTHVCDCQVLHSLCPLLYPSPSLLHLPSIAPPSEHLAISPLRPCHLPCSLSHPTCISHLSPGALRPLP